MVSSGNTPSVPLYLPLEGEVAAKLRVGVTCRISRKVTPPRRFAPTLPLKGRVERPAANVSMPPIPASLDDGAGRLRIEFSDLAGRFGRNLQGGGGVELFAERLQHPGDLRRE